MKKSWLCLEAMELWNYLLWKLSFKTWRPWIVHKTRDPSIFEETIQEGMAEAMLERMNLIDDPDLEATRTLVRTGLEVIGSPEATC